MKFILYIIGFIVFVYLQQQFRAETPKKKDRSKDKNHPDNPLLNSKIEQNKDFQAMYPESSKQIGHLKKRQEFLKR